MGYNASMCGICGVITTKSDAPSQVFSGLSDIEYRGYDSWGIASFIGNSFQVVKNIGFLPKKLTLPKANLSIGHTRWATHGGVTVANAHPHLDCTKKLTIVHNGIVENYQDLQKKLKGHTFVSETDTEVIIHLIEERMKTENSLLRAVAVTFRSLKGLNAIVVSDGKSIVVAKKGSPLVVGKSKDGFLVASDPNALLPYTKELLFLEDETILEMNEGLSTYWVLDLKPFKPSFQTVDWDYSASTLKNYPHFMLKEMYEQPQVLRNVLQNLDGIKDLAKVVKKAYGTYLIGCGTASYACLLGVYLFSAIAKKHVNYSIGSEFDYIEDYLTDKSLLIAVSQSGETIDVIEPVTHAKVKKTTIVALTNTLGSTLYRMADIKLLLQAGPEKAVASTKAYIAMQANILLLSFAVAGRLEEGARIVEKSAKEVESVLKKIPQIKKLANRISAADHMYILGRGLSFPIALESALKIKETSYIHAEGFAGGELKHGALALITTGTPVIVYVPNDETKEAVLANATEVKARGAFVIGVSFQNNSAFDYFFEVKDTGASSVIPHVVFAQLLGYQLSLKRKINPDKPRNLAKSVVVK